MKIFSSAQIREADAYTIANEPIKSIDLMERAASGCYDWIINKFDKSFSYKIFCGVGNNGGDGLVIARKLFESGFDVEVYIARFSEKCSDDFTINYERLKKLNGIKYSEITGTIFNLPLINSKQIFIDAIFGSGLSHPVTGFTAGIIKKINQSRATVISIDIPSGLFCDDNSSNTRENIVKAAYTLTFELPKLSFLFPENAENVGDWQIIPIGLDKKFISEVSVKNYFISKKTAGRILKPRKKFSHKGTYGHALLLCGSYGKMGAAVLASKACLRSGAGLTTVHIPKCGFEIVQTANPEAMASIDESEQFITTLPKLEKFNAIGIGPGIGIEKQTQNAVKLLIQNSSVPMVIDADAINKIAENKTWLSFVPKHSIFTPHPKEFERLCGKSSNDFERMQKQIDFAKKFNCYIILKGAHTCIACPDGEAFFNSTGNPGMATGGTGDVLTGFLTGLLAQKYSSKEACVLGVYLHGLAGDFAAEKKGFEALIASDIIESFGNAYLYLRRNSE